MNYEVVNQLVLSAINKTKIGDITWEKLADNIKRKLVDVDEIDVDEAFYTINERTEDIIIISRGLKPYYLDEDEYVLNDHYFLTLTNTNYNDINNFFENEKEITEINNYFAINLRRLYRLVKLEANNAEDRLKHFFD